MGNADELLVDIRRSQRDLAVALDRLARMAEGDSNDAEIEAGQDVADEAAHLSGLVGQLDAHMSASATPPADWPAPATTPADRRDRIAKAIRGCGLMTSAEHADIVADAIVAQLIREGN